MHNIKLTLQYDGTRYLGWKRQEKDHNARTVSYKIENVLEKVTGTPVTLFSGVRTEPGVHARNLTVNFLTESQLTPAEFKTVLNQYLPQDIAVLDAVSTPERFRADLNAREITYEYAMDLSPIYDLFHKNYRGRLTDLLSDSLFDLSPEQTAELPNILLMETAAHSLLGKHDFKHFSSIRKKKGTEKEIKIITFVTEESTLYIRMTANEFLNQMAPFILGTLLDIGIGKRPVECINAILDGKEKPSASCDTKGLILYNIVYLFLSNTKKTLIPHIT